MADSDAYTAFESDKRGNKRYRYYLAPAAARCESVADTASFNLPAEDIHRLVTNHLREQFRMPDGLLPVLLEHTDGLDEDTARQALRELDAVWERFADIGLAGSINSLISRVTIYPDRAGIRIDLPALVREVKGMASRKQPTQGGHANGHPTKAGAAFDKPTTQLPDT
jgi:hypothetical protein